MAKENNSTNSKDLMPIILIGGLSVGGYFIWKKFFKKEEEEKRGFQDLSIEFPSFAMVGEIVIGIIIGKNYEDKSYLCFVELVDQENGELLASRQIAEVGAGLSKQFIFEFVMLNKPSLRFNIHFGRIINGQDEIDTTEIRTISSEEGYPKEICRTPYCFMVYTQAEEIQMKDFLGLEPPGAQDMDSYLINSTPEQLVYWRDFWVNVWTNLHRQDIVEFVMMKYNQYAGIVSAKINLFTITAT